MLLCMLHNIGATSTERSMTLEQILEWTKMEASDLRPGLKKLNEMGYVQLVKVESVDKFHVTLNGIRKVLSIYS